MRRGVAELPLHGGRAPKWLFELMVKLAREIVILLVAELGRNEFLERMSSPYWFQSLGCVLGFDWHSSGLTTTVTAAIKEALRGLEDELGIYVAGGKGKTSRKTPDELKLKCDRAGVDADKLIYMSKLIAKVDNTAIQDGYQLYHHVFIFTTEGEWTVIQQGMRPEEQLARRYHWTSLELDNPVVEPHKGIWTTRIEPKVLNMVARESVPAQERVVELAREHPNKLVKEYLKMPEFHKITKEMINPNRLYQVMLTTYEKQPKDFETFLTTEGVGPKTLRALTLVAQLIYGTAPSFHDPARYSYAHGGKDGHPYPVDRSGYERTITILEKAIKEAKIGNREKLNALRRLARVFEG